MKKITSTLILLVIASLCFAQTRNFIDQPYIETTAEVDTLVTPDRIYMRIIITEKDTKGKVPVEELEVKMESTLKGLGIDTKKKLTLHDLASDFWKYFSRKKDILKSKAYTLLLEDAKTAGKVVVALEKVEISNVNITKVEYSKIESLKLKLKTMAIIKAKKQAESMVAPLNQKIGSAIYISDRNENIIMNDVDTRRGYLLARKSEFAYDMLDYEPSTIQFDKIKVVSKAIVKFKLE